MKTKTLMKIAAQTDAAKLRWTVNQLREFVVRVAGQCRTKREAVNAINAALN